MTTIAKPSIQSLFIQMRFNGTPLSTGTAFVVNSKQGNPLLITNRHNVTGRHQDTNQPLSDKGGIPNEIVIIHNRTHDKGMHHGWIETIEPLYLNDNPLWFEHPTLGAKADFVALKLTKTTNVATIPYDIHGNDSDIFIGPTDLVSVIGFPFGIMAGGVLGVWTTGFIASEPAIDFSDLPKFLIDCRARPGQSGSPVIAYRSAGTTFVTSNGKPVMSDAPAHKFLGIYSGRVNANSDLGIVWKKDAIKELVDSIAW